jgi:hypothetical protein
MARGMLFISQLKAKKSKGTVLLLPLFVLQRGKQKNRHLLHFNLI